MTESTVTSRRERRITAAAIAARGRSLWHYLNVSISAAVLILVLALAVMTIALPALVGGRPFTVLTQSMEPGLPPGTLLVVRPTVPAEIRLGDVLTYQIESGKPAVISHRVVQKSSTAEGTISFITQGDNNDIPDDKAVQEVQIVGTLWYSIPLLGYVNTAVNGDARAVIVPIAVVLLFGYAGWMLVSGVRDARRDRRSAAGVASD
ncbi:signal peptidase I [Microbacterium pygmaeum]|uniref:Signal peptidase I n=1 Tax=Microbacterium pygmaeum TaxID=370764 RepID=A0A1G7ZRH4_9MICO|nr:signal peptidase I [Microbacterium pygmaeum]SDH11187.1 signal peptidase, endoplasmic reticulum-type [Microbacterium pygmaeum]